MASFEENVQLEKQKAKKGIKDRIYDIVSVVVVIAVMTIALDIFSVEEIDWEDLWEDIVNWSLFFACGFILKTVIYGKGKHKGKQTLVYENALSSYSKMINVIPDTRQLEDFCAVKNCEVVKNIQERLLSHTRLTLEDFDELKVYKKSELKALGKYTDIEIKYILLAQKVKVKGYHSNSLLGNTDYTDPTYIGPTETELLHRQELKSFLFSLIAGAILAMIGIKDIQDWGWAGILLVLFRVTFVTGMSYLSYFKGFDDVTISLANSLNRKCDVLKEYICWLKERENKVTIS